MRSIVGASIFLVPDVFTVEKRSQVMAAIRSAKNKSTEVKLAAIFRASGVTGWRRNQRVPGRPDFVFPKERVAVFVDGCFWHGCRWHGRMPGSRREYWIPKIQRNKERDSAVGKILRKRGWRVVRIWEHSLKDASGVIQRVIRARRSSRQVRYIVKSHGENDVISTKPET